MFYHEGICYRQINPVYKKYYDYFLESWLYQKFVNKKLLIPHETVSSTHLPFSGGYLDIRPEHILSFEKYKEGETLAGYKKFC